MKITRHPLFVPGGADAAALPADAALIARLEASFMRITGSGSRFADRVYERLFSACPHLRSLFPADMTIQKQKIVASLRVVIDHLRAPEIVRNRLMDLGRAHVAFGARPEHYPVVTVIMVAAMADAYGDGWTRELADDWTSAIGLVSTIMLEGAASADPRAALSS